MGKPPFTTSTNYNMVCYTLLGMVLLIILLNTAFQESPMDEADRLRAIELNRRIYRYLQGEEGKTHRITGHPMSDAEKETAMLPEGEFEAANAALYFDPEFYRGLIAYTKPFKLLWWTWEHNEAEIWEYRQKHVGWNDLATAKEKEYQSYLQKDIYYRDGRGELIQRVISDYNAYKLSQLLPAADWEALQAYREGSEAEKEVWHHINHPDQAALPPSLADLPDYDPDFEVGNDYLEEEQYYHAHPNETNTIELNHKKSPYRPRLLYDEAGQAVAIGTARPYHSPAPVNRGLELDFEENTVG